MWGCNLTSTNNHAYLLVSEAQKQGAKLVVVDPRCTKIAQKADIYLNPSPGTDDLLAFLIISKIMHREGLDLDFIDKHTENSQHIIELIEKITPAIESGILNTCGIKAETVGAFVDLLIENKKHTIFNIGYGVQKYRQGGQVVQAIALIQILLGNLGESGTGIIYSQSAFNRLYKQPLIDYLTQEKVLSSSSFPEIPLIKLGDALETGNYKILFIYNFNPASSLPNQVHLRNALSQNDLFVVQIDLFMNETSNYADLILPTKFDLETYDLFSNFYIPGLSVNEAGPCPYLDCYSNWEIFQQIHRQVMGKNNEETRVFQESQTDLYHQCLDLLSPFIRKSLLEEGFFLFHKKDEVPFPKNVYPTPTGRIQLKEFVIPQNWSKKIDQKTFREGEFHLLTPAHDCFIHSQLKMLHPRSANDLRYIFLNSEDINALSLVPQDLVQVTNSFGTATYTIMPDPTLKQRVALIHSGPSPLSDFSKNANLFTPPQPEELGNSGSYNAERIILKKTD
ncbi:MAG: molybdopterin oxidoreductase [Promethearchaeota archaeon CR_4]|nr:MAG: molybdopterin oxidoreductase [Candidatus Lokiarchaeota archaeon CR_4]